MYRGKRESKKPNHNKLASIGVHVAMVAMLSVVISSCMAPVAADDVEYHTVNYEHQVASTDSVQEEQVGTNQYDVQYDDNGNPYPKVQWTIDLDQQDEYYLAKIVKCEAGVCDMETKIRHALVVLNRVESDLFPDTVYQVITQHNGDVYQFSPVIPGGTWYTTEPDEECYQAVQYALEMEYDITHGATYFEATGDPNVWHQRALEQVCESDGVKFYKIP